MNISAITYNNYQPGYVVNPISKVRSDNSDLKQAGSSIKSIPETDSKINTQPSDKVSQTSEIIKNENSNTNSDLISTNETKLTQADLQIVENLKSIDTAVRQHEMAHVAVGGRYITSGASFSYKRGPDGKNYAVEGEVGIDTSPIPGDPQATIAKMRQIKNAALAPSSPSPQDLKVAASATFATSKALSELMILQAENQANANEDKAFGNVRKATESYEKVSNLPQEATSTFQLSV
jgi:hypothetical protein